ncbi:hypothetical protein BS78_05G025800 [Paspalum vaginatum]|nr:hypothetical protein BS78_05G025800 [Paspalum vaginatum]
MNLCDFLNLKHLHGLVELPCLEELKLILMPSLESLNRGPFPSLVNLFMYKLPSLREVCMVAERTMSDGEEEGHCSNCAPYLGQIRVGNCVTYLDITDCPKLKLKAYLPLSLQHLRLSGSTEQLLQSPNQCEGCASSSSFTCLKKLELLNMIGLGSGCGWELVQHMVALESLEIYFDVTKLGGCDALHQLPEYLGYFQDCSLAPLMGYAAAANFAGYTCGGVATLGASGQEFFFT